MGDSGNKNLLRKCLFQKIFKKKTMVSSEALIRGPIPSKQDTLTRLSSLFRSDLNGACYSGTIIDFSRINVVDDAISLFRVMIGMKSRPYVHEFTKLLNIVVEMEQYTVALQLFDEMRQRGSPVNMHTFDIAINCYFILNRVDYGFAIFGSLLKLGYRPDFAIFATLIKGLLLDDRLAEAEKLFKKLLVVNDRLCEPLEVMIGYLTNELCKAGRACIACDYLELFAEEGYNANPYAYSIVIDSLCKGGMVEDALNLLRKMIGRGVSPDVGTYTSMIHGMCGVSFDVVTFNVLVTMLCKKGKVKEAENLVEFMMEQNVSPDVYTYNALIERYCLQGEIDVAKELFDSLADKGLKPDVYSYGSLIVGYCKKGKAEEAEELLRIMMEQNVSPSVYIYTALIDGYCSNQEMDKAKELLNSLHDKGIKPNIYSYSSLICGYCKNGRVDEAWRVFLEVPHRGLQHTKVTYNAMLNGLLLVGRLAEGLKLFGDMVHPDLSTHNILLDGLSKAHQIDDKISLVRAMEERKQGVRHDFISYNILIDGLCRVGRLDLARDAFNQLPSKGLQPNARIYTALVGLLCEKGLTEEAMSLLREMEERGCEPGRATFNGMIKGLLKGNELCRATPIFEEMSRRGFSVDSSMASMLLERVREHEKDDVLVGVVKNVLPDNMRASICIDK